MKTINTSPTNRGLRYVARDPEDTRTALLYWLGTALPARAANFSEVTQRLSPLMQVVFLDERPGVFVNPLAVRQVALVQIGSANRLELSEQNELMTRDEQAEESGGVVRWTPF